MSGLDARIVLSRDDFRLDVELRARPGRVTAILGPNGSGKTTALAAIAGLSPIDAGRIVIGERVVDEPDTSTFVPPEHRRVGMVFQDLLLFPHLSVVDNVAFGPRSRGSRDARPLARRWLARLGIDELADRRTTSLSGGQAQRVAMARALAGDPEILLLDEPLAALDASTRLAVRRELRQHLTAFAGPSLLVTHDPLDAMVLADDVIVVESGRVTQTGTTDDVAARPSTEYVAALMGANLLRATAADGIATTADGATITIPDTSLAGDVVVVIRPEAVSLHRNRPEGSPRNAWPVVVTGLESRIDRFLVRVAGPPDLTVAVTPAAVSDLHLAPGATLWASVKALDLDAYARPTAAAASDAAG